MHPSPRGNGLWWAAAGVAVVVLLAPFLLVEVPPVQDYPNHLARLYVLAEGGRDPVLAAMYEPRWSIQPNLAIDIIGPPLIRLLPVHVAGKILLAGALLLPLIGVVVYARAAFGRRSGWSLASALVAYNAIFILGFMNFLYSLAVALVGAAAWIATREGRPALAILAGAVTSAVVFFCHLIGVAFLAILIGSEEAVRLWAKWRAGRLDLRSVFSSAGALALALLPAILLYPFSTTAGVHGIALWSPPLRKLHELFVPFLAYDKLIALLIAVAVGATAVMFRKRFSVRPASILALFILLLAYALAPFATKGGSFIEPRFPVMMGLLLFAGCRLDMTAKQARLLAAAGLAILLVQVGSVGLAWHGQRQYLAEVRAAIAFVQPGERVLVASTDSYLHPEPDRLATFGRVIPELSRTDRHIAALLLIERHAFWPLLFADPAQQPLAVRSPYDRIAFPLGEPADYRLLAKTDPEGDDLVGAPYLRDWWVTFDYVLIINAASAHDLRTLRPDRLRLVYESDGVCLFKVQH